MTLCPINAATVTMNSYQKGGFDFNMYRHLMEDLCAITMSYFEEERLIGIQGIGSKLNHKGSHLEY